MRKLDEKWPYKTKKLFELIETQADGKVAEFSRIIGIAQQRINRLFSIDKRNGDFPRMSPEIESAIREVFDLPSDYFIMPPVNVELNPLDYLESGRKDRLNRAYNFLKGEGIVKKQEDVANAMNISATNLYNALNGRIRVITDDFMVCFSNAFKQISLQWLLNGEGPMLTVAPEFKSENIPQVMVGDADKDIIEEQIKMTKRIMELVNEYGHTPNTFALKANIEVSLFQKKLKGGATWSVADIHKICDTYRVRKGWLVDGEGQKFRLPDEVLATIPARRSYDPHAGVPYYNVDFELGFDFMENDQTTTPEYMIDCQPYNNKADAWCNARGNSMYPTISSGDIIALKEIKDKHILISGDIYGIVTVNGLRTIKRVMDNGSTVTLIPDNKEYNEQVIDKKDIQKVFLVIGSLKMF